LSNKSECFRFSELIVRWRWLRFNFHHSNHLFGSLVVVAEHCDELIRQHHIYLTREGRISMAGLNSNNVKYFARSMKEVLSKL
jgi:aspartate/tyrosine/aromatic aminotransferase